MPVTNNPIQDSPVKQNISTLQETQTYQEGQTNQDVPTNPIRDANKSADSNKSTVRGLSEAEMNDPNSIHVTIADGKAPLVILFGPPACGKTMTLVRLTRFLKSEGYIVAPIRSFRPTADTNYAKICETFDETMNSNDAAASTDRISFMLVEVIKNGRRICQILEAPGEYYFDPATPNAGFPNYVNAIISSSNRKIWTIMLEPNWMDHPDRLNYVSKICHLKQNMRAKDNTIFVYNKIDKTNFIRGIGEINMSAAIADIKNNYPGIFTLFMNQNPITRFFKEYNCDLVPFQTGFYTSALNRMTYQEGPKEYCVRLWKSIMNNIVG